MFTTARLRLTLWYVLILMSVTTIFSTAFYQLSTREIQRIINRIDFQLMAERTPDYPHPGPLAGESGRRPPSMASIEELETLQQRSLINLVAVNLFILVLGGGGSYFLAGQTLRPIKKMMDEQADFIANASHELRTPLTTLRLEMETALLQKKMSANQVRQVISSNLEELSSLEVLTNDLLRFSQIKSHYNNTQLQKTSVESVLQRAIKKTAILAKHKNIHLNVHFQPATVLADASSLSECFTILLDNAVKYSSINQEISITTTREKEHVIISVQDHGVGIAEAELPFIFQRFYRSEKTRSLTDGFGLGLALAKDIVTRHGGSISVISQLKHGSTFTVTLPRT